MNHSAAWRLARFATTVLIPIATAACGDSRAPSTPTELPPPVVNQEPVGPAYRLDGYVADRIDRRPIVATIERRSPTGDLLAISTSDAASGYFTFGMVSGGPYVLHFSAEGYDPRTHTIVLASNLNLSTTLAPTGVAILMLAQRAPGAPVLCTPTGTERTTLSVTNGTNLVVQVSFAGPATYGLNAVPAVTQTLQVVPGTYQSSGQATDGTARLEVSTFVVSRGCDYSLVVCPANDNRVCF